MAAKKAVFFDIDGTIWDFRNVIPDSTVEAIRGLRANGHLAFLCSGRTRAFIRDPHLLEIGFDGIVSGCGTCIEFGGERVFYKRLEPELAERTVRTVREYGFRPILEGYDFLYLDEKDFGDDLYGKKLKSELGERLHSIAGEWGKWEISKLACATDHAEREACFRELSGCFDYVVHNPEVVEMVPKGFHKGTGMEKVCELLGLNISDTAAFGDSANDMDMLRTAGVGIAMGNGTKELKSLAHYVTTSLEEDGIWNACRYFGLI